jgi:hypothetical protein
MSSSQSPVEPLNNIEFRGYSAGIFREGVQSAHFSMVGGSPNPLQVANGLRRARCAPSATHPHVDPGEPFAVPNKR